MARHRVTYLEVADALPRQPGAAAVLDLDGRPPASRREAPRPVRIDRRACPAWLALAALVGLIAGAVLLDRATTGPDERRADDRGRELPRSVAVAEPVVARAGPLTVPTRSIVAEPWNGVFEHHPDARGDQPPARVHVVTLAGAGGRALLVVDATRRAFGGPEHPVDVDRAARSLGSGSGLVARQWDAGGFGLSLTTLGLDGPARDALAAAVRLPGGASLQDGRAPELDPAVVYGLGLAVTGRHSGSASAFGSPLIGQGGGASIEGQLHQAGRSSLLVSVVEDQLVDAASIRAALGPTVAIDAGALPGVEVAAALDHGPATAVDRRIRGWSRLVLDHVTGATIELSSDVLRPAELLDAARAMDLDRLARTVSPSGPPPD